MARWAVLWWVEGWEFEGQIVAFLAVFVWGASSGAIAVAIVVASAVNFRENVIPAHAVWLLAVSFIEDQRIHAFDTVSWEGSTAFQTGLVA